jgi:hypothetical protein
MTSASQTSNSIPSRSSRSAWILISSASSRRTADKLVANTNTRLAAAQLPARNSVTAFRS